MCGGGVSALCVFLIGVCGLGHVPVRQCFLTSVTQSKWVRHQYNTAVSHLPRPWSELVLDDDAILPSFTSVLWCCEFHPICSWLMWNPGWPGEWGQASSDCKYIFLPYGSVYGCVCHFSFAVVRPVELQIPPLWGWAVCQGSLDGCQVFGSDKKVAWSNGAHILYMYYFYIKSLYLAYLISIYNPKVDILVSFYFKPVSSQTSRMEI